MKFSFDLDGVICDINIAWLDYIRHRGWPRDEEEKYYACRSKLLNPYDLMSEGDEAIFLTGRPSHLKDITEQWLRKNGLGDIPVVFAGATNIPKGSNSEFKKIGGAKAAHLVKNGIDVHFDDNEIVVRAIRELSEGKVKAIQFGSRVKW